MEGFLLVFMGMKKKLPIIIIGLIVILFVVYLIVTYKDPNRPFKTTKLSGDNFIENNVYPPYYDTVLSVAMDKMGMVGNRVFIRELSDGAKGQFDGELKAHLRYHNSMFYLFIVDLNRTEAIEVLSHEVIHIDQYLKKDFIFENNEIMWMGEVMELGSYEMRPWERNAFARQGVLINKVSETLRGDE